MYRAILEGREHIRIHRLGQKLWLRSELCAGMVKRVQNAKIACLDFSLQKTKMKLGVQVVINDPEKLDQIRQRCVWGEREYFRDTTCSPILIAATLTVCVKLYVWDETELIQSLMHRATLVQYILNSEVIYQLQLLCKAVFLIMFSPVWGVCVGFTEVYWMFLCSRESDITKERIQKILSAGATVVLTTGGIDDMCLKYFVDAGAMAVRRVLKKDLKRIAKATGGKPHPLSDSTFF